MASRVPFFFVDVFATRPLTGNPLSLVPDADGLSEARMRAIAREFSQSETTFLLRPSLPGATVRLRSFTPVGAEVGGAGHNALGAWSWLETAGRLASAATAGGLQQEIAGQVLPVEVVREAGQPATVWMDQSPPHFGDVAGDRAGLAACLGLSERDLLPGEDAQVVSTGAGHLLVPAGDRGTVDRAAPDPARLMPALRQVGAEGCYLYSPIRWMPPVPSPTPGSSTRQSVSPKTPRPEPLPDRWPPGSSPRAGSPTSPRSSSSKVTHWDGPAGLPFQSRGSAFASAVPAWSLRKER